MGGCRRSNSNPMRSPASTISWWTTRWPFSLYLKVALDARCVCPCVSLWQLGRLAPGLISRTRLPVPFIALTALSSSARPCLLHPLSPSGGPLSARLRSRFVPAAEGDATSFIISSCGRWADISMPAVTYILSRIGWLGSPSAAHLEMSLIVILAAARCFAAHDVLNISFRRARGSLRVSS